MLVLNPDAARVVGAKIAAHQMHFVVTNFCGEVISHLSYRSGSIASRLASSAISSRMACAAAWSMRALASTRSIPSASAFPGVIEHRTGLVRSSPILSEPDVDFANEMSQRLNVATIVESDSHAITLGHHWFGKGRDLDDMVLVSLEQTLGLGVLKWRAALPGAGGSATISAI